MADKTRTSRLKKPIATAAPVLVRISGNQAKGFIDFIRTQGVIGLAVGLVLGGAVSVLVKSLVDNVVLPPVGLLLGSANGLNGLSWTIGKTHDGAPAVLHYGTFLNDSLNFIIIALVVYLVFNLLGLTKLDKQKE